MESSIKICKVYIQFTQTREQLQSCQQKKFRLTIVQTERFDFVMSKVVQITLLFNFFPLLS